MYGQGGDPVSQAGQDQLQPVLMPVQSVLVVPGALQATCMANAGQWVVLARPFQASGLQAVGRLVEDPFQARASAIEKAALKMMQVLQQ